MASLAAWTACFVINSPDTLKYDANSDNSRCRMPTLSQENCEGRHPQYTETLLSTMSNLLVAYYRERGFGFRIVQTQQSRHQRDRALKTYPNCAGIPLWDSTGLAIRRRIITSMNACPLGEIGIRNRLKICHPIGFAGSSPAGGTISNQPWTIFLIARSGHFHGLTRRQSRHRQFPQAEFDVGTTFWDM